MKHLKTFEKFDLGRFSETEEEKNDWNDNVDEVEDIDGDDVFDDNEFDDVLNNDEDEKVDEEGDDIESRRRIWGDELVEGLTAKQKKLPKALQDAILKNQKK